MEKIDMEMLQKQTEKNSKKSASVSETNVKVAKDNVKVSSDNVKVTETNVNAMKENVNVSETVNKLTKDEIKICRDCTVKIIDFEISENEIKRKIILCNEEIHGSTDLKRYEGEKKLAEYIAQLFELSEKINAQIKAMEKISAKYGSIEEESEELDGLVMKQFSYAITIASLYKMLYVKSKEFHKEETKKFKELSDKWEAIAEKIYTDNDIGMRCDMKEGGDK